MKKIVFGLVILLTASQIKAEGLLDQLYGGFVGRAKLAMESTTKGILQPEFLVNYIEIGKIKDNHIIAVDAGALGEILPSSGEVDSVQWTTGIKLHVAPILKNYISLPSEWEFLGNLEIDARASYNWSGHHPTYGVVCGYPFK